MRSVYLLCAVVVLGLIAHIILSASLPLDHPLPFLSNYTVEHVIIIWWLYFAPPIAVAAIALLIWKSWMETLQRKEKIGGWIAVIVTAGINLTMAIEILTGRI